MPIFLVICAKYIIRVTAFSNDTIHGLRQDLLLLEGYKAPETNAPDIPIGAIADAFPNLRFPTGKLHEFVAGTPQQAASTGGFVCFLAGALATKGRDCIWIAKKRRVFPPGLVGFGIQPHQVVFCDIRNEKHLVWAAEEALRCKAITSVIAEVADIGYTASLRLQHAIDESRVTGLLLRQSARPLGPIASTARWRIFPAPSRSPIPELSRVGYPCWTIELEKVRNGRPGIWQMEWRVGRLLSVHPAKTAPAFRELQQKTG